MKNSAARYYCNKFDINVGFIYYPVANTDGASVPTESPTDSPTDPPSEEPTEAPTEAPTESPTEAPSSRRLQQKKQAIDKAYQKKQSTKRGKGRGYTHSMRDSMQSYEADDHFYDNVNQYYDPGTPVDYASYSANDGDNIDPYAGNIPTDDYTPTQGAPVVDNGYIFKFGMVCTILNAAVHYVSFIYTCLLH